MLPLLTTILAVFYGLVVPGCAIYACRTVKAQMAEMTAASAALQTQESTDPLVADTDPIPTVQEPPPPEPDEEPNPVLGPWERAVAAARSISPSAPRPNATTENTAKGPSVVDFEKKVGARYLVWLGGVTLALGGIFLVKYSMDAGLLSPALRVVLGILFGAALCAGSEWVRQRRPLPGAIMIGQPNRVAVSMGFAGVSMIFGSIYAGYFFHGLYGSGTAFLALAATCGATLLLSLRQGPVLAAAALAGGFIVPLMIPSSDPWLIGLLMYLIGVTLAGLLVDTYLRTIWIGLGSVAGFTLWTLLCSIMVTRFDPIDLWGLLSAMGVGIALAAVAARGMTTSGRQAVLGGVVSVQLLLALMLFAVVGASLSVWLGLFVFGAVCLGAAFICDRCDFLAIPAAIVALVTFGDWLNPQAEVVSYSLDQWGDVLTRRGTGPGAEILSTMWGLGSVLAVFFGGVAWAAPRIVKRPMFQGSVWAATGTTTILAAFAVMHWIAAPAYASVLWLSVFLGLAVLFSLASARLVSRGQEQAASVYAIAALAALAYGATAGLEHTALTAALALLPAAIAWVVRKSPLPGAQYVLGVTATIVALRLALEHLAGPTLLSGEGYYVEVLATFGLSAVAAFYVSRRFPETEGAWVGTVFGCAAVVLGIATVSLLLHQVFGGQASDSYPIAERGLQTVLWALAGAWVIRRGAGSGTNGTAMRAVGYAFVGVAVAHQIGLSMLIDLPLFRPVPVGETPVFNALVPGYLLPGLAFAGAAALMSDRGIRIIRTALLSVAGIALVVYLTLAVRQIFHGSILVASQGASDAEWYSYSALGLAMSGSVLAVGLWRRSSLLRHVSLGILIAVVAKTFLWDMASLTGLYRAVSFLGLGVVLVAVGYLYQQILPRISDTRDGD